MIAKYVQLYCKDDINLIENYDKALNDKTQTWVCHHRLEIDEKKSQEQLKKEGRYYNRPAHELIFLTNSEHWTLHNLNLRDKTRILYSKRSSGKNNGMYGKNIKNYMSEEAYNEWKNQMKGRRHLSNGIDHVFVKEELWDEYLNNGYHFGLK